MAILERSGFGSREGVEHQFNRLVRERPVTGSLKVGYHVRNQQEIDDIREVAGEFVDPLYIGLAGGRQAGKIYLTNQRLADLLITQSDNPVLRKFRKSLPKLLKRADGRDYLRTSHISMRENVPIHGLFYDIDIVVVPNWDSCYANFETHQGRKSGTPIDLFWLPAVDIIAGRKGFYETIFYNSTRIRRL